MALLSARKTKVELSSFKHLEASFVATPSQETVLHLFRPTASSTVEIREGVVDDTGSSGLPHIMSCMLLVIMFSIILSIIIGKKLEHLRIKLALLTLILSIINTR